MEALLVIGIVVALAAAGVAITRARRRPRAALTSASHADEQRALHGDVRRLRPGDVVHHEGTDFIVDRTLRFEEAGSTWDEHLLADAVSGRRLWLSVEDDDGLEVAVYERLEGSILERDGVEIVHESVTYRRDERGRASWRAEDQAGPAGSATVEYVDYAAGDRRLSFERYGTRSWEVSLGAVLSEHALDLYRR